MSDGCRGTEKPVPTFVGQIIPDLAEDDPDPRAGGYWYIEFSDGTSAEITAAEVGLNEERAIQLAYERRS